MSMETGLKMSYFSSDRAINEYAEKIWFANEEC